jgi:hypothetical protein
VEVDSLRHHRRIALDGRRDNSSRNWAIASSISMRRSSASSRQWPSSASAKASQPCNGSKFDITPRRTDGRRTRPFARCPNPKSQAPDGVWYGNRIEPNQAVQRKKEPETAAGTRWFAGGLKQPWLLLDERMYSEAGQTNLC